MAMEIDIGNRKKEISGKLIITGQQGHAAKFKRNKGK